MARGALDGLAFLDLAVVAEDHDADVVGLEVERHAAHAVLELDHLAGLHVVEPVSAGDAVADRQHLADLGDLGLLAETLDLLLEDRGDFGGADVHQETSFIASLIALSLARSEVSTMRLPSLTISPPMTEGSTFTSTCTSFLVTALSASLIAVSCASLGCLGHRDRGRHLALVAGHQLAEGAHDLAHREQPPVRRHHQQEALGEPADAGLVEHRRKRPGLLLGGENGAAHQPLQVGALGNQRVETIEIGTHGVERMLLERQLEQRGRIAARHAGYDGFLACHDDQLFRAIPQARHRRGRRAPSP